MNDNRKSYIVLIGVGGIAVIWISLLVAPYIDGGIVEIIKKLPEQMNNPFNVRLCENSLKTILIFLGVYFLCLGIYFSTRKNYRRGEEYGSAIWGLASQLNKKYKQFPKNKNKILTQNVQIGFNTKKHRRNLNVLVVGGSRGRKNSFLCKT